jgi:hypothetical protein
MKLSFKRNTISRILSSYIIIIIIIIIIRYDLYAGYLQLYTWSKPCF